MQKFAPKIEEYVKKRQYAKESYEIELYPKNGILSLKKDELLAYSGNTGGSGGPHLHFEVRDAYSRPLNPMLFNVPIEDTLAPTVTDIFVYHTINHQKFITSHSLPTELTLIKIGKNTYECPPIKANDGIGFGISSFDNQNGSSNQNGVYSYEVVVNGQIIFQMNMDRFSFSETRFINQLVDYSYYKKNKQRIAKLFKVKNNPLSIYDKVVDNGIVQIEEGMSYNVEIIIKDFQDNTTHIKIPVTFDSTSTNLSDAKVEEGFRIDANDIFTIKKGIFDVFIPKNSLYEDATIQVSDSGDTLFLHNDEIPLHKKIMITANIANYKPADQKKLYFGEKNEKGKIYYSGTSRKGNRLSTQTRNFGTYGLYIDSIPPVVKPFNFSENKWISFEKELKVKIYDKETGIKSYRATINGTFILMEYDYKTGMLVYQFSDGIIDTSQNNFELIVLDKVNNKTTLKTTFYRKP